MKEGDFDRESEIHQLKQLKDDFNRFRKWLFKYYARATEFFRISYGLDSLELFKISIDDSSRWFFIRKALSYCSKLLKRIKNRPDLVHVNLKWIMYWRFGRREECFNKYDDMLARRLRKNTGAWGWTHDQKVFDVEDYQSRARKFFRKTSG